MALCAFARLLVVAGPLGAAGHAAQVAKAQGFLAADMRPELVAQKLVGVEDEWLSMADAFLACGSRNHTDDGEEAPCEGAQRDFSKSCATVVTAMVQGSSGETSVVKEYMAAVCSKGPLAGWRQHQCISLAAHMDSAMSVDAYDNRESFNATGVCQKYWTDFTAEEKTIVAEREAEEQKKEAAEAEERKKEEEARKAEEEAAAAERKKEEEEAEKGREEAAKEAKAKAAEEAKAMAEEAQRKAEQAKADAAEAAKSLEAKRAKAEKMAADAKQAAELRSNITAAVNQTAPVVHEASSVNTTNSSKAPANISGPAAAPAKPAAVSDEAAEALAKADAALSSSA